MKIISVHSRQNSYDKSTGELLATLTDGGISIQIATLLRAATMQVRFDGASMTVADTSRSVGKAALGAVAGAVVLGPLGAIAGGVMGGSKSHTLVLNSPDARVVLEASNSEYQRFLGLGLPNDMPVALQNERLPALTLRWWVKPAAAVATVLILISMFRRGAAPTTPTAPRVESAAVAQPFNAKRESTTKTGQPAAKSKTPPATKSTSKAREWVNSGQMKVSDDKSP